MNILDFEKAEDTLGSTFYEDRGVVKALVAALESQAQAAVAEVRAEYASLVAKVRGWQEARKLHAAELEDEDMDGEACKRYVAAVDALVSIEQTLAALPLPPEVP